MLMIRQAPASSASRPARTAVDRFVEADRRSQPTLQLCVIADIVVVQRLLDHHQLEGIELGEVRRAWSSV